MNSIARETEQSNSIETLKGVHRKFCTGVTIVTASFEGELRGLVVNAFSSISLSPPLVMVAINKNTATHEFLYKTKDFAINLIGDNQLDIVRRFSSPVTDKFKGVEWEMGDNGSPLLAGSSAFLEVSVVSRVQAFTHTVFVARVTRSGVFETDPMLYFNGSFFAASGLSEPMP